jgi:predicted MPP superfamily phosphohydrolase
MPDSPILLAIALLFAWVGHACIWTSLLNYVYARPYPKAILKPWRHFTGVVILAFPLLAWPPLPELTAVLTYLGVCLFFGLFVFPVITVRRLLRRPPGILKSESTFTLDLMKELGPEVIGNGKGVRAAKLPFNDVFKVDFTEITLALPNLPPELNGLTILHLTDVHYHGTPSRSFHERVMHEIQTRWPKPDLVCLTGDYVDTDEHHTWIGPMLGRFRGAEGNFAILGNHDQLHHPEQVRQSLSEAGYIVLGNGSRVATVRGISVQVIGNEGPWFRPVPSVVQVSNLHGSATRGASVQVGNLHHGVRLRICLSHSPDQFYWAKRNGIDLVLCGHVHGGQIRVPVIGSIFVPSVYGRRFDMGVFFEERTAMVVGRGLSGKEPLRFRCHPQVILLKLVRTSES